MDKELETVARKRVQARMSFYIHLAIYAVCNAGMVAIWLAAGTGYPWFLWPILIWGVGIVAHALNLVVGPASPGEQRAVERELRRLRAAPR